MNEGELLNSCDRRILGKQVFSRLCKYCRIPYDPSKKEKRIYFRFIFGTNNPSVPENLYISSTAGTRGYFDTYCMNSKATIKSQLEGMSRKNKRKSTAGESRPPKVRLEDQNVWKLLKNEYRKFLSGTRNKLYLFCKIFVDVNKCLISQKFLVSSQRECQWWAARVP